MAIEPKTKVAIGIALAVPLAAFLGQAMLEGWAADWQLVFMNWLIGVSPQVAITTLALVFRLSQPRLRTALLATTGLFLLFEVIIATARDPNSAMLWAFYFPAAGFVFLLSVVLPTKPKANPLQGP